jgi:hypothetical protein
VAGNEQKQAEELQTAERHLDAAAEFPAPQGVEGDVQPAEMQEYGRHKAPQLPVHGRECGASVDELEGIEGQRRHPGHRCRQVHEQETEHHPARSAAP